MDRFLGFVKVFVVLAGIVIVLGTATLVWLLVARTPTSREPAAPATAAPAATSEAYVRELTTPGGTSVIDMRMADGRVLLLLRADDGVEYLALLDAATGRRLGLVRILPEGP